MYWLGSAWLDRGHVVVSSIGGDDANGLELLNAF